jgi:hypothetical protein
MPRETGSVVVARRCRQVIDLAAGFDHLKQSEFPHRPAAPAEGGAGRRRGRAGHDGRLMPVFHLIYRAWVDRWAPVPGLPPLVARRVAMRQEPLKKFETVAAMTGNACRCSSPGIAGSQLPPPSPWSMASTPPGGAANPNTVQLRLHRCSFGVCRVLGG